MKTGIGLFGTRAHQIHEELADYPRADLVAVAAFDKPIPPKLQERSDIKRYATLEELLKDDRVELVSLCSPVRKEQAAQAIMCLKAGRHVYAEKPCAMTEEDLDAIMETAEATGKTFHEMAGTAFDQPYLAMRRIVQEGRIGDVVQVLAQKSYCYYDRRPQDEGVDGGLTMQVGVHVLRCVEHVACRRIEEIEAIETKLGNPKSGELRMAVSMLIRLEGGGVACTISNYLNPAGFPNSASGFLRIFGTNGLVESVDTGVADAVKSFGGQSRTRLIVADKDFGEIDCSEPGMSYFDLFVKSIQGSGDMPMTLEEELHPTRMVIRAKTTAHLA